MEDRVRWGLNTNVIGRDSREVIADAAAGDARTAIGILRSAAQTAHRNSQTEVSGSVLEAAISEAKSEIQNRSLSKLTDHQRTLYEIIEDVGEISPGTLYDRYSERVSDAKTKRTMRNHLQKLEHYNLIDADSCLRVHTVVKSGRSATAKSS